MIGFARPSIVDGALAFQADLDRLVADAPPIILQPMSRAVLRDLFVKPGDIVVAGQLLARLDATLTEADRAALEAERRALAARVARLQSEVLGT